MIFYQEQTVELSPDVSVGIPTFYDIEADFLNSLFEKALGDLPQIQIFKWFKKNLDKVNVLYAVPYPHLIIYYSNKKVSLGKEFLQGHKKSIKNFFIYL